MFSALKKTHARETMKKFNRIKYKSFVLLLLFPDLLLNKTIGKKNTACKSPQKTNVQLAPCHNPLTRNTIKILNINFGVETLLPPNGI